MTPNNIHSRALFLGPQCENIQLMKDGIDLILDDLCSWRAKMSSNLPETPPDKDENYQKTIENTKKVVRDICHKLDDCCPFTAPVYFGHMAADTLMAANLAYIAAYLRNQNNVAYESSPATSRLEFIVDDQLLTLFGYDLEKGAVHLTSGGTISILEAYWKIRNAKSFVLALNHHKTGKDLIQSKDQFELLSLPLEKIYDLIDECKELGIFEEVMEHEVATMGVRSDYGALFMPSTKHYSHSKAFDILGLGKKHTVEVPIGKNFMVDMDAYREKLIHRVKEKKPIFAAMAVAGTTENGAFDNITRLAEIRKEIYEKYGVSFPIIVDAAYGGYARTIIMGENNKKMTFEECKKMWDPVCDGFINRDFYDAFSGMEEADVIITNPHKLGYVAYAAGACCFKDYRILETTSYSKAYIVDDEEAAVFRRVPGASTIEGSRPGATAAALYAAHTVCPLNCTGYGTLLMQTIRVARNFTHWIDSLDFHVKGHHFKGYVCPNPSFHMINWAIKDVDDNSLESQRELNQYIYERCCILGGDFTNQDFLVSATEFDQTEFHDAPFDFCKKMGFSYEEWDKVKAVFSLRSTCMNTWLVYQEDFDKIAPKMEDYFEKILNEWVQE